jgi:outer membrane protein OmpA-like peptidoglycan-associated protein
MTFFCNVVFGQALKVDTGFRADYLVDKILVGKGIRVGNVKLKGLKQGICHFKIDTNVIGMKSGLMLSTGNVYNIANENKSPGTSGYVWDESISKRYRSDGDLNKICKGRTYDQIILEFDFVPFHNNISFRFSFASEEYTEYVGSRYNDVFAFILTGGGFKKKNLAVIPGTKEAVTINNINQKKHQELFIKNDYFLNYGVFKTGEIPRVPFFKRLWNTIFNKKNNANGYYYLEAEKKKLNQLIVANFEYDGFTKVLKANCFLKPWQLYHLKVAIGDVGDGIFDSGVFLEEGSFISERDTTDPNFIPYPDLYYTMDWDSIFRWKKNTPLANIDTTPTIDENFEVTNVGFETDKFDISDSSKFQLNELALYLNKHRQLKLMLTGYTDNVGSKKYNQKLSENRALAVMYYLTTKSVIRGRMNYVGNNYEHPISDNNSYIGRARNRRVEMTIIDE